MHGGVLSLSSSSRYLEQSCRLVHHPPLGTPQCEVHFPTGSSVFSSGLYRHLVSLVPYLRVRIQQLQLVIYSFVPVGLFIGRQFSFAYSLF